MCCFRVDLFHLHRTFVYSLGYFFKTSEGQWKIHKAGRFEIAVRTFVINAYKLWIGSFNSFFNSFFFIAKVGKSYKINYQLASVDITFNELWVITYSRVFWGWKKKGLLITNPLNFYSTILFHFPVIFIFKQTCFPRFSIIFIKLQNIFSK